MFGPAVFLRHRARYIYLAISSIVTSAIFITQYLYYSYSGGFLQASALVYSGESTKILGTVVTLLTPRLIFFLLSPLFVAVAYLLSRKHNLQDATTFHWVFKAGVALAIILIPTTGYGYVLAEEKDEWGTTAHLTDYKKIYDVNMLVSKTGITNYSVVDFANYIVQKKSLTKDEISNVENWTAKQAPVETNPKTFGIAKGKNLIFLQVESLENSVIGTSINGQEITPNLNHLAASSTYFSNYYTQVGPGNTADAEFSTLNSLYPLQNEVAFIGYAQNTYNALPAQLIANGYHTAVMHGDVPSFWNRANIYPQLGYQTWFSRKDFTVPRSIGFEDLGDQDFLNQSIEKLKTLTQPYMATLITLSSHTPFILPQDLQTLNIPKDSPLNDTQRNYLQSIHYTDAAIGSFIDQLKQNGIADNAVIAIFGDHGSFTNVSDIISKPEPSSLAELRKTQVPLILLIPNSTGLQGTKTIPASHLDLFPTVSDLLGIKPPSSVIGQDLFAATHPLLVHRNLISGTVQSVMTTSTLFLSSSEGDASNGTCTDASASTTLPIENCLNTFQQQSETTRMSDLIIRGNLLAHDQAPTASANP
jgi:phosphoglycerol transferase MdoB-like AlkP superfamily enzyme